jgi:hypothetical protein
MIQFIKTEKAWILSHVVWIAAITVALVIGHVALQEHDQRVVADAQIKTSQAVIASLQQQIVAANAAAAAKVVTITKIVHDAQTPAQQVAAIPQLSDVPLSARIVPPLQPNGPPQVAVDLAPLVQELGECKIAETNLQACTTDLKNETAIAAQKDAQIKDLKRKPKFWSRVKKTLELISIAVGIGAVLGSHL